MNRRFIRTGLSIAGSAAVPWSGLGAEPASAVDTAHAEIWRCFIEWTKPGQQPVRELYNMARNPQNDLNIADKPEHVKLCDSLRKRLRTRFPVQEFKPPPVGKKPAAQ